MRSRLVIHAPTPEALARARRNLLNFREAEPAGQVELVANGDAVRAALDEPDPRTDDCLVLCERTLSRERLAAPAQIRTAPAAVHHIARRQADGWAYFRA